MFVQGTEASDRQKLKVKTDFRKRKLMIDSVAVVRQHSQRRRRGASLDPDFPIEAATERCLEGPVGRRSSIGRHGIN